MENEPVAEAQDPIQPERHDQLPNVSSYQPGWPGGWEGILVGAIVMVMLMALSSAITWSACVGQQERAETKLLAQIRSLESELRIVKYTGDLRRKSLDDCEEQRSECISNQHQSFLRFLKIITQPEPIHP